MTKRRALFGASQKYAQKEAHTCLAWVSLELDESQPSLLLPLADSLLLAVGGLIRDLVVRSLRFQIWHKAACSTTGGSIAVNDADLTLDDLLVISKAAKRELERKNGTESSNNQDESAFVKWCSDAAVLERSKLGLRLPQHPPSCTKCTRGAICVFSEICSDFV